MKMSILIFLCFLSLIMISCMGGDPLSKAAAKVQKAHIKKQYVKNGFTVIATGGGGNGEKYTHLSIQFSTRKRLTIEEARLYLVEGVLDYMYLINSSSNLENAFIQWPISNKQIEYDIHVSVDNGVWPLFPDGLNAEREISYAISSNDQVRYLIDVDGKGVPVTVHEETFEEAVEILKSEGWVEPDYSEQQL